MEIANIKDDNSYSKGENDVEKGDTMLNIDVSKTKEKNDEVNINNTELNNMDSQINSNELSKKPENKIKLNREVLKQSKLNSDKDFIENNKENKDRNNEDINEAIPGFGIRENFATKINKCFSDVAIMIITIIMFLFSFILLIFSVLDFLKKQLKKSSDYFLNDVKFLFLDILNVLCTLIYQLMNNYLKPKFSHRVVLMLIFPLIISTIIRCVLFKKKEDKMFTFIINIFQNILACLINCLTLFYFFIDAKKRRNAMHGIEEIINFSEMNAVDKNKKNEGLQLDIINDNKEKSSSSVKDDITNNNNNNEGN